MSTRALYRYPRVRSRHPSHNVIRPAKRKLEKLPFRSLIRLGSTTELTNGIKYDVVLNEPSAIKNSSNKLAMKRCFHSLGVKTAKWWVYDRGFVEHEDGKRAEVSSLPYPVVAKSFYGSRGKGNTKIDNAEQMQEFLRNHQANRYIYEVFHNYAREYRLHMNKWGCFYTCRKMMKKDTPDEKKWFRNDQNCVWVREDSDSGLFDKPANWEHIVNECAKALQSVGLDFGAVDLRVQSATESGGKRSNPDFIVIEINSAPSFGDVTAEKYIEMLPKLLKDKYRCNTRT